MTTKALRKYLARYAEPEASCTKALAERDRSYAATVVIPAYGECETLLDTLATIPSCAAGTVLAIVIVNEREDSPSWARDANRQVLERLKSGETWTPLDEHASFVRGPARDTLLIDQTQPGNTMPPRQGVGLARKIGADTALALFANGTLESPWIHCTDADVALPRDYFDRIQSLDGAPPIAAALYDFAHVAEKPDDPAIHQYELYLRYYVLGLRSAGSPYAFHTIGSTIAVDAMAYAAVRGFPKREAAEDFHLLAKLAKIGRVVPLRGEPIALSGRESERVPFGTGRAMIEHHARPTGDEEPRIYDPRCFRWLEVWVATQAAVAHAPSPSIEERVQESAAGTQVDPDRLIRLLHQIGTIEATRKLLQKGGDTARSLNENFDALATLKLIHAVRDQVHPDIPLTRALDAAPFCTVDASTSFADQCKALAAQESSARFTIS